MRFVSGLGEFELSVDRVEIRDDKYVLVGSMGVWDAETIMEPHELIGLYLKSAKLSVTLYMIRLPFLLFRSWLRGRRKPAGATVS